MADTVACQYACPSFLINRTPIWSGAEIVQLKKEKNQCPRLSCNIISVSKCKQREGFWESYYFQKESGRPNRCTHFALCPPYLKMQELSCDHRMKAICMTQEARKNSLPPPDFVLWEKINPSFVCTRSCGVAFVSWCWGQ